ncbi:helix-turn-helix domain-containing protein [Oscillospiraceae bacterium OttesenSCG-928-F05]|nr:helix-turn-helix domain-containing protein [Oscillospiraceae bacterium OttesenSCG-928-F05]
MDDIQKDLNTAVINRVQELCAEKGWTPRWLATQSGLSSKTVHQLMQKTDKQYISLTTVKKIADAFEMDLSTFFDTTAFRYHPQD